MRNGGPSQRRCDRGTDVSSRLVAVVWVPVIFAVGMALITGRYLFLAIIALSPILYVLTRQARAGSGTGHRESQRRGSREPVGSVRRVVAVVFRWFPLWAWVSAGGMAFITKRYWFLAIIALGPIWYVLTRLRRAGSGLG